MAQLTVSELRKRNNFARLLFKIRNEQPFVLTNKKQKELGKTEVIITPEPYLLYGLDRLAENPDLEPATVIPELTSGNVLLLPVGDNTIPSGALQKTWEFGSKSSELVYDKEDRECRHLQASLRKLTVFGLKPIRLTIKTSTNKVFVYDNILSVRTPEKIKGQSGKTDFEFLDADENVVVRVSHKSGSKAKDFRQWSGIKEFSTHPEIIQFGDDLREYMKVSYPDTSIFPTALCLARGIKDDSLRREAIYGQGSTAVDFLIQGKCKFTQNAAFDVNLSASLILSKMESVDILPESYEPVILVRRGDLQRGSFGIKGCRGVIYPAHGRRIHAYI